MLFYTENVYLDSAIYHAYQYFFLIITSYTSAFTLGVNCLGSLITFRSSFNESQWVVNSVFDFLNTHLFGFYS